MDIPALMGRAQWAAPHGGQADYNLKDLANTQNIDLFQELGQSSEVWSKSCENNTRPEWYVTE